MNHQAEIQRNDSSYVPDQPFQNAYVHRPEDKTAVETNEHALIEEKPEKKKKTFKHYFCCICCPCFPMWARYTCCTLFLLLVVFLIIVGVLVAIFKIPTVDFNGPTRHPDGLAAFQKSNDSLAFSVNFGLKIGVVNDNLESITFESIRTIAYYHTSPEVPVGGGVIHNVNIKSYGISNFTFPFSIEYNPTKDAGYAMLIDIATKCGLLGGEPQDLAIDYDLIPTVRIAGIAISPVIHQSSHFPCPISAGQLTMGLGTISMDKDEEEEEDEEDEED